MKASERARQELGAFRAWLGTNPTKWTVAVFALGVIAGAILF